MKTATKRKARPAQTFEKRYYSGLLEHVQNPREATLGRAYELGRCAISEGKSLLEIASLHHQGLQSVVMENTNVPFPQKVLDSGVRGYVLKSQVASDLLEAIRQVSRGQFYLSPGVTCAVMEAYRSKGGQPKGHLTSRERQVLQLIAEGQSTKDVACLLNISVKTAESHRTRLMQKLDIHETASLVRYAIRRGIVEP